ncbi:hypothetical protein, partial [Nocardia wallacei]|uniref:hypothetical protein n=1 Tax=Nocardia wallacei TaxID=480035 RepID=UPI0024573704
EPTLRGGVGGGGGPGAGGRLRPRGVVGGGGGGGGRGGGGEAGEAVGRLRAAHQPPRPGPELDRFVAAHAAAREERDTPRFRRRLLCGAKVPDHRIPRYWQLTSEVTGTVTVGDAQHWLLQALALGLDDR